MMLQTWWQLKRAVKRLHRLPGRSSRRRVEEPKTEALQNEVEEVWELPRTWELNDLQEGELDTVLQVPSPVPALDYSQSLDFPSSEERELDDEPLSDILIVSTTPAQKGDASKLSIFDLPGEIRLEIYGHICQILLQREHHPTTDAVPVPLVPPITLVERLTRYDWYRRSFTTTQLLCRQFRDEFLKFWATTSIFEHSQSYRVTELPRPSNSDETFSDQVHFLLKQPQMPNLWFDTRRLMRKIDCQGIVWSRIRHVRLTLEVQIDHVTHGRNCMSILRDLEPTNIARLFERMDEVHPKLEIEIHLMLNHGHRRAVMKRIYTLRQQPERARQPRQDISTENPDLHLLAGQSVVSQCTTVHKLNTTMREPGEERMSDWTCTPGPLLTPHLDHKRCERQPCTDAWGRNCNGIVIWKPMEGDL